MGICMRAKAVSDDKIASAIADPPLVWRILEPENPDLYLREIGQLRKPGLLARLFGAGESRSGPVPDFDFSEAESLEADLDKSWDGLNHCLKRLVAPDNCRNLFEDGTPVGKVEVGYGPALCLHSDEVARIAEAYCAIADQALLAQFAPDRMAAVYPKGLWSQDSDDLRAYLVENFAELKNFLTHAKDCGLGVIVQYT
jgi:hypothetical protein